MPLVAYRTCPQCGKMAWHEFVDFGAPGDCYWMCRECGERRMAERVSLGPEYSRHLGKVQTQTASSLVRIVNLSVLGARLQLGNGSDLSLERGDVVLFNARLQPVGPLGEYRAATVRWVAKDEFGVAFKKPLFACAADLKCVVKA